MMFTPLYRLLPVGLQSVYGDPHSAHSLNINALSDGLK